MVIFLINFTSSLKRYICSISTPGYVEFNVIYTFFYFSYSVTVMSNGGVLCKVFVSRVVAVPVTCRLTDCFRSKREY